MDQVTINRAQEAFVKAMAEHIRAIFNLVQDRFFRLDEVNREVEMLATFLEEAKVFGIIPENVRMLTGKQRRSFRREIVAMTRLGMKSHAMARMTEELANRGVSEGLCLAIETYVNELNH